MEIQCPRCESVFSADPHQLRLHDGRVCCSVCREYFMVQVPPHRTPGVKTGPAPSVGRARSSRWPGRLVLLAILILVLVLIAQVLWWTRSYAYVATVPALHRALMAGAGDLGVQIPWPGPNREMRILDTTVETHNHLAVIRGRIENTAGMVQAYPVIQVVLRNAYGSTLARLDFQPSAYLPEPGQVAAGFAPGHLTSFTLQGPQLVAAPGYQVTVLSQP